MMNRICLIGLSHLSTVFYPITFGYCEIVHQVKKQTNKHKVESLRIIPISQMGKLRCREFRTLTVMADIRNSRLLGQLSCKVMIGGLVTQPESWACSGWQVGLRVVGGCHCTVEVWALALPPSAASATPHRHVRSFWLSLERPLCAHFADTWC